MPTQAEQASDSLAAPWAIRTQEGVLALFLAGEIVIFGVLGVNFLTWANAFEVLRLSAEVGLLALAMTPIVVTGGIDLSCGSLMGLSAVLLGMLWRDGGMPIPAAALLTLAVGTLAGAANAGLITRLRLPPLIVTL